MKHRLILRGFIPYAVLMIILALLPIFVRSLYDRHIIIMILLSCVCALGVRLILNIGKLSFAQGSFLAVGAYTSALLSIRLGLSFWLCLPLAGFAAALFALVVGYPALKLKGVYFAMLTFGLVEAVRLGLLNWRSLTRGAEGLPGIPPPDPIIFPGLPTITFMSRLSYYYLCLGLLVLTIVVMYRLDHSRLGLTFRAIAQSDNLAASLGINLAKYNILAFVTACFFTGLAGSLLAHYVGTVAPAEFGFWKSVNYDIYAIVGGTGNIFGPMVGTGIMIWLGTRIMPLGRYELMLYGAILVLVVILLPGGFISLLRWRPTHLMGLDRIRMKFTKYISR